MSLTNCPAATPKRQAFSFRPPQPPSIRLDCGIAQGFLARKHFSHLLSQLFLAAGCHAAGSLPVEGEEPDLSKGNAMLASPPKTKTDLQLANAELDAELQLRKAPLAEPLPQRNNVIAKWLGIAAVLMFAAGFACLPIAKMIDPTAEIIGEKGINASVPFVCTLVAFSLSFTLGLIAVVVLLTCLWFKTHLREIKEGIYYSRWISTEEEWQAYIDHETTNLEFLPWRGAIVTSVVGLTSGLISIFVWPAATPTATVYLTTVGIIFGFATAGWSIGKTSQVVQRISLDARRRTPEAAIIGLSGLYFNKQFHPYKIIGSRLHKFTFLRKGKLYMFEFQFEQTARNRQGYVHFDVRVPIPAAKLAEAKRVYRIIRRSTGVRAKEASEY